MDNKVPMQIMKDKDILDAYQEAVRLELTCDFIQLLKAEMDQRD